MNPAQLLKLLLSNRELIQRSNHHALSDLNMLRKEYGHLGNEEVALNLELNTSLAEIQFDSRYDKALKNSSRVIEQFKDTPHRNLLARHYWVLGKGYAHAAEFHLAEKHLRSGLEMITEKQPGYVPLKSDLLVALAMNEQISERGPDNSILYLNEAISILGDESMAIRKANCLMGLGNVYINSGKPEEALKYYHEAEKTFIRKFDLANMASVYSNIGTCYIELQQYAEAEKILIKSLELRMKVGSPEHLSISYYNLAMIYRKTGETDRAYDLLVKSREIILRTGNKAALAETEQFISEIEKQRGEIAPG